MMSTKVLLAATSAFWISSHFGSVVRASVRHSENPCWSLGSISIIFCINISANKRILNDLQICSYKLFTSNFISLLAIQGGCDIWMSMECVCSLIFLQNLGILRRYRRFHCYCMILLWLDALLHIGLFHFITVHPLWMSMSRGSQAEFPGGGLGQRPEGTVVITYCPGVILLVSGGYICNYMLSGGDFYPRICTIEVSRGCIRMKVGHVQGDISACPGVHAWHSCPGVKCTQSTHP